MELIDASEELCSAASKRGKYRHPEVTLGPYTDRFVPFIIIPMKDGRYPIEVKAQVKDSYLSDGIRKLLRVVVSKLGCIVTPNVSNIIVLDVPSVSQKQFKVWQLLHVMLATCSVVRNFTTS